MATLRKMPSGMVSGPVTINWTTEERLQKAQDNYRRACDALRLAKAELDGLIEKSKAEPSDDLLDIMVSASRAWVTECERSRKTAKQKLEDLTNA